ncbi:hypothetical protein BSLG_005970 [Batrachochytrium salamandrivorans]|nr:hypothetical protein BSLG_005970 [Batrachochytrium salamandrivorans]
MLAATVQADPVVRKQGESALSDCSSQSGFLSSLCKSLWFQSLITQFNKQIALEDKTWVKQHIISAISSTNALIRWVSPNARAPLHPVIADMFPLARYRNQHQAASDNKHRGNHNGKTIIKIYNCSIRLEICEAQQDLESLIPWGSLFVDIIELQLPAGALSMPEDKDERQKHSWWKLKSGRTNASILFLEGTFKSVLNGYGSAKPEKRYAAFSKMFAVNFAPKILECFLRQIQLLVQGMWMSDRAKQHLAAFLEHCCRTTSCRHLPDRFKQAFVSVVTIINEILAQYDATPAESRNPCHKYGILNMMACLVEEALNERSPIRGGMETF